MKQILCRDIVESSQPDSRTMTQDRAATTELGQLSLEEFALIQMFRQLKEPESRLSFLDMLTDSIVESNGYSARGGDRNMSDVAQFAPAGFTGSLHKATTPEKTLPRRNSEGGGSVMRSVVRELQSDGSYRDVGYFVSRPGYSACFVPNLREPFRF